MIATDYLGVDIFLMNDQPDWRAAVRMDVDVVADLHKSLTNREGRRAFASTIRVARFNYTTVAQGQEARLLSTSLREYQAQPVAVPMWPAVVAWANRGAMPIDAGLKIAFMADWSDYAIYEAVEPGEMDFVAPLLYGRLEKRELRWADAETAEFEVQFVESSPALWALAPAVAAWTAGPSPSVAYAVPPKLFPFAIDFDTPKTGFNVSIIREQIGFGRESAETLYPQTNARDFQAGQTMLTAVDIGKVLRFWQEYGPGAVFWASNWVNAAVLTADIGAPDTVLQVEDTDGITEGDYLGFINSEGIAATARVTAKTDDTITIDAAVGARQAAATVVSQLMLCRFEKTRLSLSWAQPDIAECSMPVREVPPEYTPAADEVIGTSLGLLPTRVYLYEFARTLDGVVYTDRFTSFEGDLVYGGNTYSYQKLNHGELRQGLYLDRDQVTVNADIWEANPLLLVATLKMESPLYLTMRQADLVAGVPANVAVLFFGEVTDVKVKGSRLTANAVPGSTMFDRKIPRVNFQRSCNNSLFDAGCKLLKADWKFTAQVQNVGAAGYPFEFILDGLDRALGVDPTYTENFFAGGWLEFGSGLDWGRRAILRSTLPVAGVLTVTLDRDPDPFLAVNDDVILYPGCDLQWATCKAKFNNKLNFIGHPHMPHSNPSAVRRSRNPGGGKK